MKVRNMTDSRGNQVPNQFEIHADEGVYFQSYKTVIAFIPLGYGPDAKTQLDERMWDCSVTTSKYRNQFLRETTKETKAKIASSEYALTDLNA